MRTCAVCLRMCICFAHTFEALVELSQTDEVWEGQVTCFFFVKPEAVDGIKQHVLYDSYV